MKITSLMSITLLVLLATAVHADPPEGKRPGPRGEGQRGEARGEGQ